MLVGMTTANDTCILDFDTTNSCNIHFQVIEIIFCFESIHSQQKTHFGRGQYILDERSITELSLNTFPRNCVYNYSLSAFNSLLQDNQRHLEIRVLEKNRILSYRKCRTTSMSL